MNSKKLFILSIIFPILILSAMAIKHAFNKQRGGEVILKITGYDPRDLLSGHYVTYQVNYELDNLKSLCSEEESQQNYSQENEQAFICFSENRTFTYKNSDVKNCPLYLRGSCSYNIFKAGIERFYIPERFAKDLDTVVRDGQGKIVVSIQKNGEGIVKDLLINDEPFKEWLKTKK